MSKRATLLAQVQKARERRQEINANRDHGPLTKRQREVLDFIRMHIEKCNFPPTVREIAAAFGFTSLNSAQQHLRLMEKKGAIKRDANFARAITILDVA